MTEQAIQHIKQVQESTGFIEDIISNNLDNFLDTVYPECIGRIYDYYFSSDGVTLESPYGDRPVTYEQLTNWINSI